MAAWMALFTEVDSFCAQRCISSRVNWPPAGSSRAWTNAVRSGLYTDVIDHKNRVIASAYALKNPLEYFAELSAARFVGIDYHLRDFDDVKAARGF